MRFRIPLVLAGAVGGVACGRAICRRLPARQWERQHRDGSSVSLFGGLETATGTLGAAAVFASAPIAQASLITSLTGGVAGWVDDHLESRFPAVGKGFKGHLGALCRGKLTSGMLKIILIGAGSAASALILQQQGKPCQQLHKDKSTQFLSTLFDAGLDTVIVAGTANLLNLLDLRPGRALKSGILLSLPALFSPDRTQQALSLGLITTALCELPDDLSGEKMLGDLGANAYGGAIGALLAAQTNKKHLPKSTLATVIVAMTLASEKVSFSQVIESTPVLRELDQLGR